MFLFEPLDEIGPRAEQHAGGVPVQPRDFHISGFCLSCAAFAWIRLRKISAIPVGLATTKCGGLRKSPAKLSAEPAQRSVKFLARGIRLVQPVEDAVLRLRVFCDRGTRPGSAPHPRVQRGARALWLLLVLMHRKPKGDYYDY